MRVFASLGLILLLSSCSDAPTETKAKPPEKPPAPITAQQAFRYTYPAARAWAGDALPLRMRSIHLTDVPAEPGKAGAWEVTYVSPSQQQARIYTWAAVEVSETLHKDVFAGKPQAWSGSALGELREKLSRSRYRFTTDNLQKAHEVTYRKALVDIVSMVKHAADEEQPLYTATERVERAFTKVTAGQTFTADQQKWLDRIKQHMRENLSIDSEDFDLIPVFSDVGGLGVARKAFGAKTLDTLLNDLNEAIAA